MAISKTPQISYTETMITSYFQAAVLGIVQGVTEFLPISSTAHLIMTQRWFHLDQSVYGLSFDMFTNLGTLAAICIVLRQDIARILGSVRPPSRSLSPEQRLPWIILLATIPAGITGFLFEESIATVLRSPWVIVFSLVSVGILMILVERSAKPTETISQKKTERSLLGMGLAQTVALIPGVSRSGITITAGLAQGMKRAEAARYSFLLSLPIVIAATTARISPFLLEWAEGDVKESVIIFYCIGAFFSFVSGYLSLRFLLHILQKYSLAYFAYYRFALAALLVFLMQ